MNAGSELIVDAFECERLGIETIGPVRAVCDRIVAELELLVVGEPQWHQFPAPGGVTGLYLLTESHLACHTFPERGLATFNLYCCNPRPEWPWSMRLSELLGAGQVRVRRVSRGDVPNRLVGASERAVAAQGGILLEEPSLAEGKR